MYISICVCVNSIYFFCAWGTFLYEELMDYCTHVKMLSSTVMVSELAQSPEQTDSYLIGCHLLFPLEHSFVSC